jgi:hypothetical protein
MALQMLMTILADCDRAVKPGPGARPFVGVRRRTERQAQANRAPVRADKAKVMAYSPVESNRADHLLTCPDGMTFLRGVTL